MRIDIDLPKWADERHIYIMAGVELVAYKEFGEKKFHIKTSRCRICGECCKHNPKKGSYFPLNPDGSCSKLGRDGEKIICTAGGAKPFPCCYGDPVMGRWGKDFCSIRYDEEK